MTIATPPTGKERKARLARIQRARMKGQTWTAIAQAEGLSRQRVRQIFNGHKGDPPNPLGENRPYRCAECRAEFRSTAKRSPDRCPHCGSYRWKQQKD